MNKTISHLNTKTWYRLAKVAFVFSFLVACGLTVFLIFSSNLKSEEVIDKQNTKIICQLGNEKQSTQKEIFGNADIGHIDPSLAGLLLYMNLPDKDSQTEKILRFCEISDAELQTYVQQRGRALTPYRWEIKYTEISEGIFMSFIYSLIGLVIIAFIFEIVRRSFYYIILGTFKPKKE